MEKNDNHDMLSIRIALARIEERLESNLHRTLNVDSKIDAMANKLDKYVEKEDLDPLRERIKAVESTQNWIVRSAVASMVFVGAGLYSVGKKIGLL